MDLATQLTFVKHSVRSRLDELKRMELKRLNELERRLDLLKAKRGDKDVPEVVQRMADRTHIDHENPSSFEIDDLDKLIRRSVADLENIDDQQQEEFKKWVGILDFVETLAENKTTSCNCNNGVIWKDWIRGATDWIFQREMLFIDSKEPTKGT